MRGKTLKTGIRLVGLLCLAVAMVLAFLYTPLPGTLAEPGTPRGVGAVYGPYTVTHTDDGARDLVISGSGGVYEITVTCDKAIIVNNANCVIVLAGISRSWVESRMQINGNSNVTLYLAEGTTNIINCTGTSGTNNQAGIYVAPNASLTIQGPGRLEANGGNGAAGIGGSYADSSSGAITIESGTVVAKGSTYAAGIGSSHYGATGPITIKGGSVTATGGNMSSAGIGGGGYSSSGSVTITGGEVKATGGNNGSGIGSGGFSTYGVVSSVAVTISGGTVTAQGGSSGAGIGGGYGTDGGTITITGGDITATGGNIGSGIGGGSLAPGGTINISGGNIKAVAGGTTSGLSSVAGIGGGGNGVAGSTNVGSGNITISGGTIDAIGTNNGAGIGSGPAADIVGTITITGGTIVARSQQTEASGVGGGKNTKVNVIITGGSVYSTNATGMIRVNTDPSNGSQLVYLIGVKLLDEDRNILPDSEITVSVKGGTPYDYSAMTNSEGIAYLWLPAGPQHEFLLYNPDSGTYLDYVMEVKVPANPVEYDPSTNTAAIELKSDFPHWSFANDSEDEKAYGATQLTLDIDHNNPGTHPGKSIAGVKWFRESVEHPENTQDSFDAGFAAAAGNNGTVSGGTNELLHTMNIDRNGRYWVQIHYIGANTGKDVYHVAYLDVDNIYVPIEAHVRDWNDTDGIEAKAYAKLTRPEDKPYGIPYDLDGVTVLASPPQGYDALAYPRNGKMPKSYWDIAVPGAPFEDAAADADSALITLDRRADNNSNADANSDATHKYYTVNYTRKTNGVNVEITKTVTGDFGDETKQFDFTIYFADSAGKALGDNMTFNTADGPMPLDEHGKADFKLSHGQSITIEGVAPDGKICVIEAEDPEYDVSWLDSEGEGGDSGNTGPLDMTPQNRSLEFINESKAIGVNVKITKAVRGDYADKTKEFRFTVFFEDVTGASLAKDTIFDCEGALETLELEEGGKASFFLAHGQSVTIKKVPSNGKIRIAEEEGDYYDVSFADEDDPGTEHPGNVGMWDMTTEDRAFLFIGIRKTVAETGISIGDAGITLLPLWIAATALIYLATMKAYRRRKRGALRWR